MSYLALLAGQDIRKKSVSVFLVLAGAITGAAFRAAWIAQTKVGCGEAARSYLPGLLWGLILLAMHRASRCAVGEGDGLCFLSFAFWLPAGKLFVLLLSSLALCAFGGLIAASRRKCRNLSLPFLPFVLLGEIIRILTDSPGL